MLPTFTHKATLALLLAASVGFAANSASADTVAGFKAALSTTPVSDTMSSVVVTQVIPFITGASTESFLVQDATGAAEVFGMPTATYTPHVGDTIDVTGLSEAFHGLFESHSPYTVAVDSTGGTAPAPAAFTTAEFQPAFGASLQSFVGTLSDVTFTTTGTFASNGTYAVTDGINTATVFIPSANPLIGVAIPTGAVDLTGYYGEFDNSSVATNAPPNSSGAELDALSFVPSAAAPEPASLGILAASGLLMLTRRRRQA